MWADCKGAEYPVIENVQYVMVLDSGRSLLRNKSRSFLNQPLSPLFRKSQAQTLLEFLFKPKSFRLTLCCSSSFRRTPGGHCRSRPRSGLAGEDSGRVRRGYSHRTDMARGPAEKRGSGSASKGERVFWEALLGRL